MLDKGAEIMAHGGTTRGEQCSTTNGHGPHRLGNWLAAPCRHAVREGKTAQKGAISTWLQHRARASTKSARQGMWDMPRSEMASGAEEHLELLPGTQVGQLVHRGRRIILNHYSKPS